MNKEPPPPREAPITAERIAAAARLLGLGETASRADLSAAYRRLVAQWHPDRHGENTKTQAEERFKEINAAYELLDRYMRVYRYSFRPADVRRDQEDPIQQLRRRFGWDAPKPL